MYARETVAIAAGRPPRIPGGPVNTPVVFSSTFHAGSEVGYARTSITNWEAFEETLGLLEGGDCLSFASGLAAVSAVLELVPIGGIVVVPDAAYSGTLARLDLLQEANRLTVRRVNVADSEALSRACQGANLVIVESPTNPTMEICDLRALAIHTRANGALLVCDNTFATPLLQRPLALGADVVLHSATKFISGHSDLLMGALVVADHELRDRLHRIRSLTGGVPGPMESFLALRGLRTLALRIKKSQSNAMELATRLTSHPSVVRVRYPGLSDDPGHDLAAAQMDGFGGILAIESVGDPASIEAMCSRTRLWVHATSLGGIESMLERRRRWEDEPHTVPEELIRLTVGCEDIEDLWADLCAALDTLLESATQPAGNSDEAPMRPSRTPLLRE